MSNQIVQKISGLSKKKKIMLIILIGFILLAVFRIISTRLNTEVTEKIAVNVKTAEASISTIEVTTPLSGIISAEDQVSLIATLQTEVTHVNVKVGDYVSKGDILFTQNIEQVQASYNQASANVAIMEETLNSAKTNYDRMAILYKEGAVSQQQYEQAETQYKTSQGQLKSAQASQDSAQTMLSNGTMTAPINGYVTEVNVTEGAYPSPAMAAISIANTTTLELNTNVSEYLIGKVKLGDKVSITAKSLSDKPFEGTIKTISPAPASGSLTYPITIALDQAPEGIKAGMFAEVNLISDRKADVLCVPSDSVIIKSSETKVAILKKGIPSYVSVETGLDNGSYVEIKSGLKVGDLVVTEGQHYIIEGEEVNIIK